MLLMMLLLLLLLMLLVDVAYDVVDVAVAASDVVDIAYDIVDVVLINKSIFQANSKTPRRTFAQRRSDMPRSNGRTINTSS